MSLLIKNALIVNATGEEKKEQDILLEEGKIKQIADSIDVKAEQTIDAKGLKVLPGLIDIHVHFRSPGQEYKESIETGSKAAAKGGFTTVFCMPNTDPVIDSAPTVKWVLDEAKRVGLCNVFPIGAITKGQNDQELVNMKELHEAGCVALSDDGKSVLNSQLLRLSMEYAKMFDLLIIEHCQDFALTSGGVMNEGVNSTKLGFKGDPGIAESVIVGRDIEIANYLNTRIHICHVSLKRCVELIRFAKSQGIGVTAEVCPHHFTLTDDAVKDFSTNAKMNPPLRTQEDIDALKEALKDGTIDCIITDHAPHSIEDKEVEFDHAPFGIIGLETSFGLSMHELVHAGVLSLPELVLRMAKRPAEIMKLDSKGEIKEGMDADIAIVDPDQEWEFTLDEIASKSRNTPFLGRKIKGRVKATICNGKVTYKDT